MKKLLCFVCFGLLMLTAIAAQPTRAVAQMQSDAVVLTDYAQPDFVDFVIVSYDMGMDATTPEDVHVYYDAPFADCNVPVFDLSLTVFRLCGEYSYHGYNTSLLIAHPASAGHGLNLQHGGRVVVWSTLTYNYELFAQGNARLARQGQTRNVQCHYFVARKTCEENAVNALVRKQIEQQQFLNLTKQ